MTVPVLIAALLFVLPRTPPDSALKGWEREDVVALPYAAACQRLSADLATDGWRLVRTERLGEGIRLQEIRKFANVRGETVIFRLWRIGTSVTGYAYRRDRRADKGATSPSASPFTRVRTER